MAYLFQSPFHNVASRGDLFLLANSVDTIKGLIFEHGVPLWLHEKNMVSSCQIKSRNISSNPNHMNMKLLLPIGTTTKRY